MKLSFPIHKIICFGFCFAFLNCSTKDESPQLAAYTSSECKDVYFKNMRRIQNRILEQRFSDSLLVCKIFVVDNCERTEEGAISISGDTLDLIYHGVRIHSTETRKINDSITEVIDVYTEALVECDCAYELTYKIEGFKKQPKIITLNGKRITETKHKYKIVREQPTYKIIDNDTINFIDIYGLKQGVHVTYRKGRKLASRLIYIDGEPFSGLANVRYDSNGLIKEEMYMDNRKYSKRKHYKNGKLIKVCDTEGVFDDDTNCEYVD
ncbi:hypothetical protein [uncultured Psychroserpens sp.]|uniref:hypothetical protein n=1 Tax=uncultured Psychroserpens sp. TaxID=255436 RepID=UPI002622A181|nr:hypothetical protein [uncultured Psychroserpens sp.]